MSGAQVSPPEQDAGARTIEEIDILWLTPGLNCVGRHPRDDRRPQPSVTGRRKILYEIASKP